MASSPALGRLSSLHELLNQLLQDLPEYQTQQNFLADQPSIGWLFGHSMYLELVWIREKILGDADLSARIRPIFSNGWQPGKDKLLPPKDHLLNWALEIQDHHLSLLANPNMLPPHPWLEDGWLVSYLNQVHAQTYEQMLAALTARSVSQFVDHQFVVSEPLVAHMGEPDAIEVSQGHYRIGAKEREACFDNELPTQVVQLHNYRICKRAVSNAEYLLFMQEGGYSDNTLWSESGWAWKQATQANSPWHWRQDAKQNWFAVGLNGGLPLLSEMPVSGLSWHEARAFCQWADKTQPGYQGAILPHEYQWEAAARTQGMNEHGLAWEWCGNVFEPYDSYEQPADAEMRTLNFGKGNKVRKGGSLHTQPELRRLSLRQWGKAEDRHLLTGLRLVLPPALEQDALYIEQWKKLLV